MSETHMTRDEMISRLHQINVGVSLVALTSEGALECSCVTPEGSSYEWLSLDDWQWPVYRLNLPCTEISQLLQAKLKNGLLEASDVANTELERLYFDCVEEDERSSAKLNKFLLGFAEVKTENEDSVYVLVDAGDARFFIEYEELEEAFTESWYVTPWEDCSDDYLASILDAIDNEEFDSIPCCTF